MAFSAAVWVFFFFVFQVATLIVDPFRPPQPGFSFLRSQSYWCSLSCQKRPFLSSWQQAGDGIKLLVAVLSLPDEGCAGGCHPSRAGQLEEGDISFPKSRCGTGQPHRTAAQAARPWLNYGAAPRTLPIPSLTETLFSCHQKANKTQAEEDKK